MSAVWKYFKLDNDSSPLATCNVCNASISRGGTSKAAFNTTNLIRHLKTKHTTEYCEFTERTQEKAKPKQHTLEETFKRRQKFPLESCKAKKITERVVEFIALDDQPLSVVENTGFRRLFELLEPRYVLPSRHYITENALPELHNKVRNQLLSLLSDSSITSIAFTTDIWSSDVCPMSLLSLTAHWIDQTFNLKYAVLHCRQFRASHTAENIKQTIEDMLNSWKVDKQRVHVILRDNARNMKKAMEEMGVRSVGCVAHTLQLVVHEGLLSQRCVTDTLAIARKIVGHFKHSPQAYARLEDIQLDMNIPTKRLQQDVQVRWNSSLYMMQSLLEQKRPLSVYAADHNLPATLTANQWMLIEKTVNVLAPFEELTRAVSAETATAADVIPAITVLKRVLSRDDIADHGIKTMKTTLLEAIHRRFSEVETEPLYCIATLLDPRYKDRYFTNFDNNSQAKAALIQEVEKVDVSRATATEPVEKAHHQIRASTSLGSVFDEILEERETGSATTSSVVQVQSYLSEQTIPRSDNPLQYWKTHAKQFPLLAAIATRFLCAPCTSVNSERLFSAVGNVIDEKRNRLSAAMAEMLIFVKKNLDFIKDQE